MRQQCVVELLLHREGCGEAPEAEKNGRRVRRVAQHDHDSAKQFTDPDHIGQELCIVQAHGSQYGDKMCLTPTNLSNAPPYEREAHQQSTDQKSLVHCSSPSLDDPASLTLPDGSNVPAAGQLACQILTTNWWIGESMP